MCEKESLQQNNSMIGGYNMAKTSFAGTENNLVKGKNGLIKPITFGNPNSSGQVRFLQIMDVRSRLSRELQIVQNPIRL